MQLYVLLGHHTKLTHAKFYDKKSYGKNECARHYKSGFTPAPMEIETIPQVDKFNNLWFVILCVTLNNIIAGNLLIKKCDWPSTSKTHVLMSKLCC